VLAKEFAECPGLVAEFCPGIFARRHLPTRLLRRCPATASSRPRVQLTSGSHLGCGATSVISGRSGCRKYRGNSTSHEVALRWTLPGGIASRS
jgi:hypothetical protein